MIRLQSSTCYLLFLGVLSCYNPKGIARYPALSSDYTRMVCNSYEEYANNSFFINKELNMLDSNGYFIFAFALFADKGGRVRIFQEGHLAKEENIVPKQAFFLTATYLKCYKKQTNICILLDDSKVYWDTIVPTYYKKYYIQYSEKQQFSLKCYGNESDVNEMQRASYIPMGYKRLFWQEFKKNNRSVDTNKVASNRVQLNISAGDNSTCRGQCNPIQVFQDDRLIASDTLPCKYFLEETCQKPYVMKTLLPVKKETSKLCLIFPRDETYFDTIIPMNYKKCCISLQEGRTLFFRFEEKVR